MVTDYPNQYKRISKDDLRDMLDNGIHTKGNEGFILTVRDALIRNNSAKVTIIYRKR
jgi:hypothetical protein